MARTPLLQINNISLTFGGDPIFQDLDFVVQPGDRVALVGRNGSGKSTLMKIMAGLVEPDRGERILSPGITVGYMQQHPDLSEFQTLGEFAESELPVGEEYRVAMAAEGLKFNPDTPVDIASGGERRRAALAKLLAEAPELMLLDEPTNHLDIEAIQWLEEQLKTTKSGFILISHDRAFLTALTTAMLWVDRGIIRRKEIGFDQFEAWRDKTWQEEDDQRHKLNRKIKSEARWAVEGISARRKRNQGRLRALQDMRQERAQQIKRQGAAAMALDSAPKSGRRVIEADAITKTFQDHAILSPFSIKIHRGDRVGIVGPNGAGKTTLLKMLIGNLTPESGTVRLGTNLEISYFGQNREKLDPNMNLWESLTGDPDMRVSGKADQVMVRGTPKHVVGYLKEFLFDEQQAWAPIKSLSGGEKARLLLAKLMAKPSNLLILDEPTNDLDVETLDLLQDLLGDYDGTVILVSHDRDFLDRAVATTIALEGRSRATVYAGGWSDYQAQRYADGNSETHASKSPKPKPNPVPERQKKASKLSYKDQRRLDQLPTEIERLEAEIVKLETLLAGPDLFIQEPLKFKKATEALVQRQTNLADAELEWLELEEKSETVLRSN